MKNDPVQLPPLATMPRWASTRVLDADVLHTIHQSIIFLKYTLNDVSAILSTVPGPTRERLQLIPAAVVEQHLRTMLTALQSMSYPTELTVWITTARSSGVRAAALFNKCLGFIQQLLYIQPAHDDYRDGLETLRHYIAQVGGEVEILDALTEKQLVSSAGNKLVCKDAYNYTASYTNMEWSRGWQRGIREAEAIIRDTLRAESHDPQALAEAVIQQLTARLESYTGLDTGTLDRE